MQYIKELLLIFGIFFSLSAYGQKSDSLKFDLWVDAGFGVYSASSESGGLTPSLSLNLYQNETLYKIRYLQLFELDLFGPTPSEAFQSYGALVGKGISNEKVNLFFSVGLGITTGIKRGDLIDIDNPSEFERNYIFTPSIPLEIDILWKITKFFGPNFTLFADLNIKRPYLGYMIKLSIGKLR